MRRKAREQADARRLRETGWSLRQIASHLDVALSSVSIWVRDAPHADIPVRFREHASLLSPLERVRVQRLPVWTSGVVRRCGRCRVLLPGELFNRHATGLQWWCRKCLRAYHRTNRERGRARAIERRERAQAYVLAYLRAHPCVDCGEPDPEVLEFDHVRGKRTEVSVLVHKGIGDRVLAQEIAKCEVVCANCHRRRTARRGGWRRERDGWTTAIYRSSGAARNAGYAYGTLAERGCVDCGERDLVVLDFDHIDRKVANVSALVRSECRLATLVGEIARCEVRCASCHRRRTRERGGHLRDRAS
jgi:hypothetical protein